MSDINTNLFTVQAEKYLAGRLEDLAALTDIKAFICGAVTEAEVPMDLTPYCEIFIESEDDQKGMLSRDESTYTGKLRFVVNLAAVPGVDFTQEKMGRVMVLDSHSLVGYYVKNARDELRRCINADFDNLTTDGEYVCEFKLSQSRYGLGFDQKNKTWFNVGEIDFFIRAQRPTEV